MKSLELLNTVPVGEPPGIVTVSAAFTNAVPLTSPVYNVDVLVPLFATQNAPPVGLRLIPQGLTSAGS
jgi:hypothetical protein